jgi:tetratricopeptide (TPR) repeat protein
MSMKRPALLLSCLLGLTVPGCQTAPPDEPPSRAAAETRAPVRLADVPAPPGVPSEAVSPLVGEAAARARQPLSAVLAKLERPEHLAVDPATAAAEPRPAPPLAAQKFYAAGRQSLLDGDNFGAVQAFDKALRLAPRTPAILRGLGQAWARTGNRVSAAEHYRRTLDADPSDLESLLMLGRFALEDRDWERAIVHLDAALEQAQTTADHTQTLPDPAAPRLIRFYLANALHRAGHLQAAAEVFQRYLESEAALAAAPSGFARELALVDAQRGETLKQLGDIHHRLNQPRQARATYLTAARVGVLSPETLRRRLIYTQLRLGQKRSAEALVAESVAASEGNRSVLELIRYAMDQGVPVAGLGQRLTELYESEGRPAALALAMADVLPPEPAAALLERHLSETPGDAAVFGRLLDLILDASNQAAFTRATEATVDALIAAPASTARLLGEFDRRVDDPSAFLESTAFAPPRDSVAIPRTAIRTGLRGRLLIQAGQPFEAEQVLGDALALDPQLDWVRLELARLAQDREAYVEADQLLEPLADQDDPRVVDLRVRALTRTDRPGEALALLDRALASAPPGSPLRLQKADLLLEMERPADAEQVLLDALNAQPTNEAIYARLLAIYENNGDMMRNYQRLIRRMFETIPDARLTQLVRAQTLLAMNRYTDAEPILEDLAADGRDADAVRLMQMEVFVGTNQGPKVIELIDQHLADAGDDPDPEMLALASKYFQRAGDTERYLAMELLRWQNRPPSVQRSLVLAQVYYNQDHFERAVEAASDVFKLAGEQDARPVAFAGRVLAQGLVKLGDEDRAMAELERVLRDQPAFAADFANQLAASYQLEAQFEAGWRVLARALEQFPRNASLNNSLGYGLATRGQRLEEAERYLTIALEQDPDEAAYLDSMGWILYKQARFEPAVEWLEKSRRADPDANPIILDHLGDAYYRLGRNDEAVRVWSEARTRMSAPEYRMIDPEEQGLPDRLTAKLEAVAEERPAPVADLGMGVEAADPPAANQPPEAAPPPPDPATP